MQNLQESLQTMDLNKVTEMIKMVKNMPLPELSQFTEYVPKSVLGWLPTDEEFQSIQAQFPSLAKNLSTQQLTDFILSNQHVIVFSVVLLFFGILLMDLILRLFSRPSKVASKECLNVKRLDSRFPDINLTDNGSLILIPQKSNAYTKSIELPYNRIAALGTTRTNDTQFLSF